MKKKLRTSDYVQHILTAIERIADYTEDLDLSGFMSSELVQDAVLRNIEIVGEASKNVQRADPSFVNKYDFIPWEVMYAMRNQIAHGYFQVDLEIVWKTIENDFPELYEKVLSLEKILNTQRQQSKNKNDELEL